MSETDLAKLRELYGRARLAWERAKSAHLLARASIEKAQRDHIQADSDVVEIMAVESSPWVEKMMRVEVFARASRSLQFAQASLDEASKAEAETHRREQEALAALIGTLP